MDHCFSNKSVIVSNVLSLVFNLRGQQGFRGGE